MPCTAAAFCPASTSPFDHSRTHSAAQSHSPAHPSGFHPRSVRTPASACPSLRSQSHRAASHHPPAPRYTGFARFVAAPFCPSAPWHPAQFCAYSLSNDITASGRGTTSSGCGRPGQWQPASAAQPRQTTHPHSQPTHHGFGSCPCSRPAAAPASPVPAAPAAATAAAAQSCQASSPCIPPPARRSPATPQTTTSRSVCCRNGFTIPSALCSTPVHSTGATMPPSRIGRFGHIGSSAP